MNSGGILECEKRANIEENIRKCQYFENYNELCNFILSFKTPIEILYAAYYWITHNIAYAEDTFQLFLYQNKPITKEICDAKYVFQKRKAVCSGYVNLFLDIIDHCPTEIKDELSPIEIVGITNSSFSETSSKEIFHKWCAFKINNKYYIFEPTWGSGYVDPKTMKFISHYSFDQFLIPPQVAINNHFPNNKEYQFIEKPITKEEFLSQPFIYPDTLSFELKLLDYYKNYISLNTNYFEEKISFNDDARDISCFLYKDSVLCPIYCYNIKYNKEKRNKKGVECVIQLYFTEIGKYVLYIYGNEKDKGHNNKENTKPKMIMNQHFNIQDIDIESNPILIQSRICQNNVKFIKPNHSFIHSLNGEGEIQIEMNNKCNSILDYRFENQKTKVIENDSIGFTQLNNYYCIYYICEEAKEDYMLSIYFDYNYYCSFYIQNEKNHLIIDFFDCLNYEVIYHTPKIHSKCKKFECLKCIHTDNIVDLNYRLPYKISEEGEIRIVRVNDNNGVINFERIKENREDCLEIHFDEYGFYIVNIYFDNEVVFENLHFYIVSQILDVNSDKCCVII